jgi:hypothetical protein
VPCPECAEYRQRAEQAAVAEQSLLLFTELFSKLARQLWDIEAEAERRRHFDKPPPPGAAPVPKRRFLLIPADMVAGVPVHEIPPEVAETKDGEPMASVPASESCE